MIFYPYRLDNAVMRASLGESITALSVGPIAETIFLCGVCLDNLNTYLIRLYQSSGTLEWTERRVFGNLTRALGQRAWDLHLLSRDKKNV